MTQQPSDSDFEDVPVPSTSKSSVPVVLWILAGLGCGCFSLILLGIIAAIALPSLLSQANKGKQAEAIQNVGSMLRAEQAYQIEKGKFSPSIEELSIGIKPETINYRYEILPQTGNKSMMITAQSKTATLKSYSGAVFAVKQGDAETTIAGICETQKPSNIPPAMPKLSTPGELSSIECPPGSKLHGK